MKKKKIILCFAFLLSCITLFFSLNQFYSTIKKTKSESANTKTSEIAVSKEESSIIKKETKDAFYYTVFDAKKDLSYTWKFKKEESNKSILENLDLNMNFNISLDKISEDTQKIDTMVEQNKLIVSFDYHGALPEEATIRINVADRFQNGEKLYLYYYNPQFDQIEYITHDVKVNDGYVEFTIDHCSDYFLTAAVVNDAVNNPKSINLVIILLGGVVFVLIAVTLVQSKK